MTTAGSAAGFGPKVSTPPPARYPACAIPARQRATCTLQSGTGFWRGREATQTGRSSPPADPAEAGGAMDDLIGHSITYRVAVGPRAGQQVFALQSVPARSAEPRPGVAQRAGFSLHAGIGVEADQRAKLERLARYVSRPPVSIERLALTAHGAGALSPEDPVPRRHHAHRARTGGLHGPAGGAGAAAAGASDALSWGVRPACGVARGGDAGGPRAGSAKPRPARPRTRRRGMWP